MAVNVHAPYGQLPARLNASRHQPAARPSALRPGQVRPGMHPRGLAVWVQPGEGREIDPEVWARAAEAVLARARKLAPGAEVLLWPAAGAATSGDYSGSEASDPGASDAASASEASTAAANPPVSLAGRAAPWQWTWPRTPSSSMGSPSASRRWNTASSATSSKTCPAPSHVKNCNAFWSHLTVPARHFGPSTCMLDASGASWAQPAMSSPQCVEAATSSCPDQAPQSADQRNTASRQPVTPID